MKKLILCSFFFNLYFSLFAQDLTEQDQICPSSPVSFKAPDDSSAFLYNWDFCTGDLLQKPNGFIMSTYSGLGAEGIEIVHDHKGTVATEDDQWFGFITNSRTNTMIRMDFGASLENSNPTLTSINIQFTNCYEMAFIRENGKWYALVARNINNPILIHFDSLSNNTPLISPILDPLGNYPNPYIFGGSEFTVKLHKDGNNLIGVFLNSLTLTNPAINDTRMVLVNFGNSITTPVTLSNILIVPNIGKFVEGTGSNPGFDIIQDDHQWYAVTCGTNNIRLLSFGENLFSIPTVTDITPNITNLNPSLPNTRLRLIRDGSKFLAFILNTSGQLLRLDFGESMNNLLPQLTNLGNLGVLAPNSLPTFTFDLVKQDSQWHAFIVNRSLNINILNQIIRADFPNPCNANPVTSNQINPDSVVFLLPEQVDISLETIRLEAISQNYFEDKLEIVNATVGNFSVLNQCIGETTIFENYSFGSDENVAAWEWDFGDGSGANVKSPAHLYNQSGTYPVSLRVFNKSGCENIVTKQVNITDIPQPNFIVKSLDCNLRAVEFEDISFLTSRDIQSGVSIVTREWSFGDNTGFLASTDQETGETRTNIKKGNIGSSGIAQVPAYTEDSIYQVSLTITNSENCVATVAKNISFREEDKPQVDFDHEPACTGRPIRFRDLSLMPLDAIGEVDTWKWKVFDTGGFAIDSSTIQNPSFIFDTPGTYSVRLQAQFSGACPNATTKDDIEVFESLISDFNVSTDIGIAPLRVAFENKTSAASSFEWSFGDGRISTEEAPTYVYTEPGVYVVEFQAKNANNCGTIASSTITVLEEEQITAEEPIFAQNIQVYPNPSDDIIFIRLNNLQNTSEVKVELFDLFGKKITQDSVQSNSALYTLSLGYLQAGVYLLKLSLGTQSIIKRITKF